MQQKILNFFKLNAEKIVFFSFIFLLIYAISTTSQYYDVDLWARLVVGKAFWQSGLILKQDFLSFIPTEVWFDHEWGSGVIFYAFYKLFSFHGFILLHTILIFSTFYFIQKTLQIKNTKDFNLIIFAIAIFTMLDVNNSIVRCQSITFLFFSIYIYIFELARNGNKKYLWITPILMLFWCNIHGGCIAGLGLFTIYILGEFLSLKDYKYFIAPFILNIAVIPINPWGIDYLGFLAYAGTLNRIWIAEWYNLFDKTLFLGKYIITKIFVFCTGAMLLTYVLKSPKRDWTKILLTLTTIVLGILHIKHIPFVVITVMIFFYDDIYSFFKKIFDKVKNQNICKILNVSIYLLLIIFIIFSICKHQFSVITGKFYPIKSVEFLKINNIKGNLLCDFSTGSYIEYKLYPQNKVYMDGRYEELFSFNDLKDLMLFLYAEQDSDYLLNKYPIDIILARNGYTVLEKLIKSGKWTPVFYENDFITLIKTDNLKNIYTNPSEDIEHYKKTFFDTDINFMLKSKPNARNK